MSDNTARNATSGGDTLRDDDVIADKIQVMKVAVGRRGVAGDLVGRAGFPVANDLYGEVMGKLATVTDLLAARAQRRAKAKGAGAWLPRSAGGPAAATGFDPATLNLSGWWRASYTGAPWTANASVGISATTGNLVAGTAPGTGTAVNGFTPPDFNGTTHNLVNANNASTLFNATTGTIVAVYTADTAAAVAANPFEDPNLFTDTVGVFGLKFCDQGIGGYMFDGVSYTAPCDVAVAAGAAYHAVRMRWDTGAGFFGITLDGGAEDQVVLSAVATGSMGTLVAGANFGLAAFFDGRMLELMTMPTAMTDPQFANVKSYVNTRYGLSL